jgi:hypothetical protein
MELGPSPHPSRSFERLQSIQLTQQHLHTGILISRNTMNGSCACGAVKYTTPTQKPLMLFHCHCIDCRKQSSSAFGTSAIFPYFSVAHDPSVSHFVRKCDSGRQQYCYFCTKCGSRILHATIVEGGLPDVVAVKGGLLEGLEWAGAKHIFCRSAVVPIPEGVDRWEAEPDFGNAK